MTTYVALLRGIGPMNPNMKPAKLKQAFETMGLKHVRTVIASGNVVFESSARSESSLETKIEKALPKLLGFSSTTIIRSKEAMEKLLKKNPAGGLKHGPKSYILVTFLKAHSAKLRTLPRSENGFEVLGVYKKELCSMIDTSSAHTPDIMARLEREFGKEITSRTWKTVERIAHKMQE